MKISLVSDTITVIELSPEEMSEYDFAFEESDYSSPHTRKILWSIIDDASRITGKTVEISRGLEIDFLPDIKGGGLLIISEGDEENEAEIQPLTYSVFQSESIDNIMDFAKCAQPLLKCESSSLYYSKDTYRLSVDLPPDGLVFLAKEFSLENITSPYSLESTKEAFRCLIAEKALEILSGTASEK